MTSRSPDRARDAGSPRVSLALDASFIAIATLAAFWPVVSNGFVNWDDPEVLLSNPHLGRAGIAAWAFSTTLIGHYQPLAWLVWSAVTSLFGLSPAAFHALSLAGHLVNGVLVYVVALRLVERAAMPQSQRRAAALLAAVVFAVHPLRVEPVAWASAYPYVLSLTLLLLALLAYLNGRLMVSVACYAASMLVRASAFGWPVVLLLVDVYPLARHRRTNVRRLLLEKVPFAVVAIASALVESRAREAATLQEIGVGPRLTMAVTAPFVYLWRTVWPVQLSPLDPLPIAPAVATLPLTLGIAGLVGVSALVWTLGRRWPLLAVAWTAYVVTLAPVVGLLPSGLQATADRYVYLPGLIVSLLIGAAVARAWTPRRRVAIVCLSTAVLAALTVLTWRQTRYWHDSIALWTRAVTLDDRNDVATYNLAIALVEARRQDEAIRWYEHTLRLVPDHDLARRDLAKLQAARAETQAGRLAAAGHLEEASQEYARALALDSTRPHARAAHGMVLLQMGRMGEAAAELRIAYEANVRDPAVLNALAFALIDTGGSAEAVTVLKQGMREYPDDLDLAHNLARILATASEPGVRDGALALQLALEVRNRTNGRDARALDTLAAAYAAAGHPDLARETARQALARAREIGDTDLAEAIAAHARSFGRN
jgi:tetratricopeptide (TPR) repeat protein